MASAIKVDEIREKTSGNGIVLKNSLKDSTGTNEIISPSGGITVPSGQSISNFTMSSGTTAERPMSPSNGMMRYNTTTDKYELYQNGWRNIVTEIYTNNYSLSFDGYDDYLVVSNMNQVNFGTTMSVAIWYNADSLNSGGERNYLIDFRGSGSTAGMSSYHLFDDQGSGQIKYTVANSGVEVISPAISVATGIWHLFVSTRSGNTWKIYHDGVLIHTGTTNTTALTLNNTWRIGTYANASTGQYYFDGYLDEVSHWTSTLSDSEVATLYNNRQSLDHRINHGNYISANYLSGYWRMEEGAGGFVNDVISGNHATINGAAWSSETI